MGVEGLRARAREFTDFFSNNLVRHFQAEEEVVFPLLNSGTSEMAALIRELLADHEKIREMDRALRSETGLAKVLFDAGDLLERHIRREERELFPLLDQCFGLADGDVLRGRIEKILAGAD
jgi:iron-sulfur cluster repair protein YtfE (RIC family)